MLNDELLFFHKTSLGIIPRVKAFRWIQNHDNNPEKLGQAMRLFQSLLEKTNPTQEQIQEVIDTNVFEGMDEHLELFTTLPYPEAIKKLYELPEKDWGHNCWMLLEFFTKIDRKLYHSVCRLGCEHEWHNLHKIIRSDDLVGLVEFYKSLGMQFNHAVYTKGERYEGKVGQSELWIYHITKSSKKYAGLNFHLRFRIPDFDEVIHGLNRRQIPVLIGPAENGIGLMAELKDPDGRKVTLYNTM